MKAPTRTLSRLREMPSYPPPPSSQRFGAPFASYDGAVWRGLAPRCPSDTPLLPRLVAPLSPFLSTSILIIRRVVSLCFPTLCPARVMCRVRVYIRARVRKIAIFRDSSEARTSVLVVFLSSARCSQVSQMLIHSHDLSSIACSACSAYVAVLKC